MRVGKIRFIRINSQHRLAYYSIISAIIILSVPWYTASLADPSTNTELDSPLDNTLYHLATEQNDPAAQYLLGRKYFTGSTVTKDTDAAIKWFKLAADQNHAKAQFQLGKMYLYGEEGVNINYVYALGYLRDAAGNNYAEAQFELGNYYLMGKAENVDYAKSLKWYRAAADQQHVRAMVALGTILYEGKGGIEPRPDEAKHYLSLAAEYGDAEAIKELRKISNHTHPSTRNSASITTFHTKLNDAAAGHIPSQYEVGMAYLKGNGVDTDTELAAKWLRRAAVNDYSKAQYMLSQLYRDGVGVKKDRKRALEWLQIAASAGVLDAQKELQSMHLSESSLDYFEESDTLVSSNGDNIEAENARLASTSDADATTVKLVSPRSPTPTDTLALTDTKSLTNTKAPTDKRSFAKQNPPANTGQNQKQHPSTTLASHKLDIPPLELQPTMPEAQFQLANRYLTGDNIKRDSHLAIYWLEQAAMQYHPQAQYQLGKMYKEGKGVTASAAKAKFWLTKASDAGYEKADLLLKDLRNINVSENFHIGPAKILNVSLTSTHLDRVEEDHKPAPTPVKKAKKIGLSGSDIKRQEKSNPTSVKNSHSVKNNGVNTLSEDVNPTLKNNHKTDGNVPEKLIDKSSRDKKPSMVAFLGKRQPASTGSDDELNWLLETAKSNNDEAQLKLAEMYFYGRGVQRNLVAAADWYQKAANMGNAEAQFKLGNIYKEGLGVEKNNSIAIMWYRKAANQGHLQAKRRLGGCRIC